MTLELCNLFESVCNAIIQSFYNPLCEVSNTHTHQLKYKHERAHTDTPTKCLRRNSIHEKYENITKQMKITLPFGWIFLSLCCHHLIFCLQFEYFANELTSSTYSTRHLNTRSRTQSFLNTSTETKKKSTFPVLFISMAQNYYGLFYMYNVHCTYKYCISYPFSVRYALYYSLACVCVFVSILSKHVYIITAPRFNFCFIFSFDAPTFFMLYCILRLSVLFELHHIFSGHYSYYYSTKIESIQCCSLTGYSGDYSFIIRFIVFYFAIAVLFCPM